MSCQQMKWCTRFISRKMLRFSCRAQESGSVYLSVRGRYSSVMVKNKDESEYFLLPFHDDCDLIPVDAWRGCHRLDQGMRICFVGPDELGRLEFEVFYQKPTMNVYIVPFGQDLPKRRIKLLEKKLQEKHIPIVLDYQQATHLVVSRSFRDVQHLAMQMGSSFEELQLHLDQNDVQCLLPQWVLYLNDSQTFAYHWAGYSRVARKKHNRPLALKQISGVRNAKRNEGLVNQLLALSKAYESASLFEEEQWRALQFHKLAGRLQCLDFDVTKDNFSKTQPKLRGIAGFGNSALAVVEDVLFNGSCRRVEYLEKDPARVAVGSLMRVHGIGRVQVSVFSNTSSFGTTVG